MPEYNHDRSFSLSAQVFSVHFKVQSSMKELRNNYEAIKVSETRRKISLYKIATEYLKLVFSVLTVKLWKAIKWKSMKKG